jgi:hypothetical protein
MRDLRGITSEVDQYLGLKGFSGTLADKTDAYLMSRITTTIPENMSNIGLEAWSSGDAVDPDGFVSSGADAAIAKEAVIFNAGSFSAKLTSGAGEVARLTQTISDNRGIGYWQTRVFTFTGYVYATAANVARLFIFDGTNYSYSAYHAGDSAWAQLSINECIPETATTVAVGIEVADGTKIGYLDDVSAKEDRSSYFRNMTTNDMLSIVCKLWPGTLQDQLLMQIKYAAEYLDVNPDPMDSQDVARYFYTTNKDL